MTVIEQLNVPLLLSLSVIVIVYEYVPAVVGVVTQLQLELIDGYTVIERHTVPWLPLLSVIVTVYVNVPFTVGVAEIAPLLDSVSPDGNPVASCTGRLPPPLPTSVTALC